MARFFVAFVLCLLVSTACMFSIFFHHVETSLFLIFLFFFFSFYFICFFLFVFFFKIIVTQDHNGFVGTWVDNFGFTVQLCITDGQATLEGTYNEFGLIKADLLDFGESATGTFYNTRYQTDDECPRGDFNWHLNGNTVRGSWVCYDHLSGGEWTLDRIIPQDRPSESECFTINDSANRNALHGAWDYDFSYVDDDDDWDICIDGDVWFASYGEPGTVGSTYQFGEVFEDGLLLSGSYLTIVDSYGSIQAGGVTIELTEKTDVLSFNWVSPSTNTQAIQGSSAAHFTWNGIQQSPRDSTGSDCERNAFLSIGYYDDDDYIPNLESSGSALTYSMLLIALVAGVIAF